MPTVDNAPASYDIHMERTHELHADVLHVSVWHPAWPHAHPNAPRGGLSGGLVICERPRLMAAKVEHLITSLVRYANEQGYDSRGLHDALTTTLGAQRG